MKKSLIAGAVLALIAGQANAAGNWGSQTYGADGAAWWQLNADAAVFCKLNAAGPSAGSTTFNSTITPGANGQGGSVAEADGTLKLNIQDPATNTIRNASAFIKFDNSQCNTTFKVSGESANGGLKNTAFQTWQGDFTNKVEYNVGVEFGSQNTGGHVGAPGAVNLNWANQVPTAGTFRFSVDVPANANKLLLAGTYSDFPKVTMAPVS